MPLCEQYFVKSVINHFTISEIHMCENNASSECKLFRVYDKNGDNFIQVEELKATLMKRFDEEYPDQEANAKFNDADWDRDGKVSFEEFLKV